MDRIIFVSASFSRRPQFQLRTVGIKTKGDIHFLKQAYGKESEKHLQAMSDIAAKAMLGTLLSQSRLIDSKNLEFEFIQGREFDHELVQSVLFGSEDYTSSLLDIYDDLLDSLSDTPARTRSFKYDSAIFGEALFEKFDGSSILHPGILDLTFDNLIIRKDALTVIDYEWTFKHGLPRDYILARSLMWFGLRYASVFKLHSEHIEVTCLAPNLLLPTCIYNRYKNLDQLIKNALSIEWNNFQPWVNGTPTPGNIPIIVRKPVKYSHKVDFALDELISYREKLTTLEHDLISKNEQIKQLQSRLDKIASFIPLRAGTKVYRTIKNISIRKKR